MNSLPSTTRSLGALAVLLVALGLLQRAASLALDLVEVRHLCPLLAAPGPSASAGAAPEPSSCDVRPPPGSGR